MLELQFDSFVCRECQRALSEMVHLYDEVTVSTPT